MHIQDYVSYFHDAEVQISPEVRYNLRDVIDKNNQMRNSQFENPFFSDGETEKTYYNALQGLSFALKRGSRILLREHSLTNLSGRNQKMVDILKLAMRNHLRLNGFVDKKDEIQDELIDMGHVVTKVVNGETYVVDLRNLIFRPDRPIKESGCAEKVYMTYEEAHAEYGKHPKWSEIQEHYDQLDESEKPFLTFIEHWKIDEFTVNGKKEVTKGCIKYLDKSSIDPEEDPQPEDWEPYVEFDRFASPDFQKSRNPREKKLYGEKFRIFPYEEQPFIRIPGRSMGMGVYELGRSIQEDYIEKGNYKRKFDMLALRGILIHKIGSMRGKKDGEAITQEFLKRMETGSAMKIFNDENLERLNMGSTTPDTLNMMNFLFELMRFLLGVTPQAIGETSSNRTASFAIIQNQTQQTTYQVIKNRTGRLLEKVIQNHLLPDIIEDITAGDYIAYAGEPNELEEIDRFLIQQSVYNEIQKRGILVQGGQDTLDAIVEQRVQESKQQGLVRSISLDNDKVRRAMKKLIKNLDYIVEFNFTDEALDVATKIRTLLDVAQIQDPKIKAKVMDLLGINARDVELNESERRKLLQERVQETAAIKGAEEAAFVNNLAQTPEVTAQGVREGA